MDIYGVHSKNTLWADFDALSRPKQVSSASDAVQGLFSATLTQEMQAMTDANSDHITQRYTFDEFDFSLASRAMLEEANTTSVPPNTPIEEAPLHTEAGLQSPELPEFNVSFLEKLKSGMSFQDALMATKKEYFGYYFQKELEANGGDVKAALEHAEAQLKGETSLTDEELYAIVKDIAGSYSQAAAQTGSAEMQRIADELNSYVEELEKSIDLDKVPTWKGSTSADGMGDIDGEEESDLKASFVQDLMEESSLSKEDTSLNADKNAQSQLTEKDKRERDVAIKQYQKMSSLAL